MTSHQLHTKRNWILSDKSTNAVVDRATFSIVEVDNVLTASCGSVERVTDWSIFSDWQSLALDPTAESDWYSTGSEREL